MAMREEIKVNIGKKYEYAGFFRRAYAYWLDILMLIILLALVYVAATILIGTLDSYSMMFISTAMMLLYWPLSESTMGGTPGKRMLGIKIINYDGSRISFLKSYGRLIAKGFSIAIFMLGIIQILFNDRRRAFHDVLCDTYVVKTF